jgi:diguanylate cyclase (GGDEF)-like protein
VLCLDLDHFKDVNDTLGHPQGDMLLQIVAQRLKNVVRDSDVIGRLGGDEFAIVALNGSAPEAIAALATRIRDSLACPYTIEGNQVHVSASIGISFYASTIKSADEMMIQADLALYRSKHSGRNRFCVHSPDLDCDVHERATIAGELRIAIEQDQLELYYQPQVESRTGRIVGMEALVRWNHPTRGLLSPAVFIPAAETTGMIVALGRWVLEESCRQIKQWRGERVDVPRVGVNLSAAQLKTAPHLDRDLAAVLARYGIAPHDIEIELTEFALMEATEAHGGLIGRIRALGIGIAIDDFGTGYSSLEYLRSYQVSRLKIAREFIRELGSNPGDAAIVRATIGLARELGLEVIAEGVETAEQLAFLDAAGCRYVQGYYFGRRVPAAAAADLMREGTIGPAQPRPALMAS